MFSGIAVSLVILTITKISVQTNSIVDPKYNHQPISGSTPSFPIDLRRYFNNRGFGLQPNESNFDGLGGAYPAQHLPPANFTYSGITYIFPQYTKSQNDNILCRGQTITVPHGQYSKICILASSQSGLATGNLTTHYDNGASHASPVLVPAWWNWPYPAGGDVLFPYYLTNSSINYNRSSIYQICNWLDSTKNLMGVTLPNISRGSEDGPRGAPVGTRLHVFALSIVEVPMVEGKKGPVLRAEYARSTQKWIEGMSKTQIVEVVVSNIGTHFSMRDNSVFIAVDSEGLRTVRPASIIRLAPGDQVTVEIGVENRDAVAVGQTGPATVIINGSVSVANRYTFNATYGIRPYHPSYESIYEHESPNWFKQAKFGIFIHWGVYAVPAWGNVGKNETYSEWYWWNLNQGPSTKDQTYQYHLRNYGPNITYDSFIANFTASVFNAKEWVDLFADSGAKYFVMVTKHHDGYALFDLPPLVSKRTSVALPPHRDFVQELFDASKKYQPSLRRGTYYSVPEWFHPDYEKYGFRSWPGGQARDAFNASKFVPYIGYVPVKDYLSDLLLPSMETLATMGTEIIWCDIGGPNLTLPFAAAWYNNVTSSGRQVIMNNRCGIPGDFDTPEYPRSSPPVARTRKWESNRGMDPYSYGYNAATPESAYMNASTIVRTLVDIVAKNGNFLLDIGPRADGTVPEIQAKTLREAGVWIKEHADAIFTVASWFVTPQEGEHFRFAISHDAFFVYVVQKPIGRVRLESPVPWVEGDEVKVVGGRFSGRIVRSWKDSLGRLVIDVPEDVADGDKWVWIFRVEY